MAHRFAYLQKTLRSVAPRKYGILKPILTSNHGYTTATTTTRYLSVSTSSNLLNISLCENPSCSGCGVPLQFQHTTQIGYCNAKFNTKSIDFKRILCQRCYQLRHYGKLVPISVPASVFEQSIKELRSHDSLIVQLVDILDIEGSLLPSYRYLFGKKDIHLVVNKMDLLPRDVSNIRIATFIKSQAKKAGITSAKGIHLVSSASGFGIKELIHSLQKNRQGRDICVIGTANAGKSTFLNKMLKLMSGGISKKDKRRKSPRWLQKSEIVGDESTEDEEDEYMDFTTSPFPGTTLAVQAIPLPRSFEKGRGNILDTPGIIVNTKTQNLMEYISTSGTAKISEVIPQHNLPMTTFRMKPGKSIFLGGLVRIDYENENDKLILFSWFGKLPGSLSKTMNADTKYEKHLGGLLAPPAGDPIELLEKFGELRLRKEVILKDYVNEECMRKPAIHAGKKRVLKRSFILDVVVPGFGWGSIGSLAPDGSCDVTKTFSHGKIKIFSNDALIPQIRPPLLPFESGKTRKTGWIE